MTCKQVAGAQGWSLLKRKVRRGGPQVLFQVRALNFYCFVGPLILKLLVALALHPSHRAQGAGASFAANVVGHFPWFAVYNLCDKHLPEPADMRGRLLRNATMGFAGKRGVDSSCVWFRAREVWVRRIPLLSCGN